MKQLELFSPNEREVQPQQRLATSCVANSAYGEVTNRMKPEGARYQAVTQVKGLAVMDREGRDTSFTHRGGQRKSTKLSSLSGRALENPRVRFSSLAHILTECFRELKRNKATGVDGVAVEEYEVSLEENLKDLVERLKEKRYRPKPVRRVYIPKPKGGKRPLGIPAVEDKIVQMGLKKVLEAIFEVDFLDVSFGFRPRRNGHQALNILNETITRRPVNYIVDMDIEKFFEGKDS